VQLRRGHSVSADALIALVRDQLGPVHAPKAVDFMDQLPRSTNGKVLKTEIRAAYWRGHDRPVG
jgi:acyl-coenzyme A synthetase/AMP-(fatty) acid ligase